MVAIIELITQSPLLTGAGLLLAGAIALSILRGLIGIAKKIAIIGAVLFLLLAGLKILFPDLVPLTVVSDVLFTAV